MDRLRSGSDREAEVGRMVRAQWALAGLAGLIYLGFDQGGMADWGPATWGTGVTIILLAGCAGLTSWLGEQVGSIRKWAAVQLGLDILGVSALVYFSGDLQSGFIFLYPVIALYGATLLPRRPAWFLASTCAAAYGSLILLAGFDLPLATRLQSGSGFSAVTWARVWASVTGALVLAVMLAGRLTSELHRREEALDESARDIGRLHDLHDQIIGSITSGLLTTDTRGRISSFNPQAERITGLTRNDVTGRPLEEILPGAQDLLGRGVGRKKKLRTRKRLEYRTEAGVMLFLGVASSRLVSLGGQNRGHVVIFQDVSDVVAMEDELRRSERMAAVGEMAAKIAHEIRNPLASIAGSIQLMVSSGAVRQEKDETRRLTEIVMRESQRLNGLLADFLEYSRPVSPFFKELRVDQLAEELMVQMEQTCPDGVALQLSAEEPVSAWADSEQLKQVIWNLAMNGIEAMPSGGELEVVIRQGEAESRVNHAGRRDGTWAEIEVRDSGPGVDPDLGNRIFEPFFTTKAGGSGLGLASVHQALQTHGGSVCVEKVERGGALFRVRVPGVLPVS